MAALCLSCTVQAQAQVPDTAEQAPAPGLRLVTIARQPFIVVQESFGEDGEAVSGQSVAALLNFFLEVPAPPAAAATK